MLVELAWFTAGCAAGGYLVYQGMRGAMLKELTKRPWTEEEMETRAGMLSELATLSKQKDKAAIQRSKELRRRLVDDDVNRGQG